MKKFLLGTITVITLLTSCSKEKTSPGNNPPEQMKKVTLIQELYSSGSTNTESFKYDAQGRLSEWNFDKNRCVFDYSVPGKLLISQTEDGAQRWNYVCDLNSKGNVTKLIINNPDGSLYGTYQYEYNSEDYIIYTSYAPASGPGFNFTYQLENGNLVSYTQKNLASNTTTTASYTNDLNLKNTLPYSYAGAFPGDMFGRNTKNLHTGLVMKRENGTLIANYVRAIEVNSQGYAVKVKSTNTVTGYWTEATYTY